MTTYESPGFGIVPAPWVVPPPTPPALVMVGVNTDPEIANASKLGVGWANITPISDTAIELAEIGSPLGSGAELFGNPLPGASGAYTFDVSIDSYTAGNYVFRMITVGAGPTYSQSAEFAALDIPVTVSEGTPPAMVMIGFNTSPSITTSPKLGVAWANIPLAATFPENIIELAEVGSPLGSGAQNIGEPLSGTSGASAWGNFDVSIGGYNAGAYVFRMLFISPGPIYTQPPAYAALDVPVTITL